MSIPQTIVCVDCGGTCHLLVERPPDYPWEPGDVAAYRCVDCLDRWDMVIEAEDLDETAERGDLPPHPT
ncbi:MAG: hypothetical protein GY745_22735 [Actinomycetia bacterium]|nr:hypothetical protein [Actinomycetes bacterium]MCP4087835.1 hypothetical protein [Actinomycetes bacterium]